MGITYGMFCSLQGGGSNSVNVDDVVLVVIAAAAHLGNHYWTNTDNRQLAKGNNCFTTITVIIACSL